MPRPKPSAAPKKPAKLAKHPTEAEAAPLTQSNVVLWTNVLALMNHAYGKENLTRLARECKMSPANATRIKVQRTSIGLEVIEKVAKNFELDVWALMVPNLDPTNRPVLRTPSESERGMYASARKASEAIADFLEKANTRPGDL